MSEYNPELLHRVEELVEAVRDLYAKIEARASAVFALEEVIRQAERLSAVARSWRKDVS